MTDRACAQEPHFWRDYDALIQVRRAKGAGHRACSSQCRVKKVVKLGIFKIVANRAGIVVDAQIVMERMVHVFGIDDGAGRRNL